MSDGLNACGSAAEDADDSLEVFAVLFFETCGIDAFHAECGASDIECDTSIGAGICEVASPAEPVIGFSRGTASAECDFVSGGIFDGGAEFGCISADDGGEFFDVVEVEVFAVDEAVAEWCGEHTAAGGGADDGELLEFHIDGAGIESITECDIDAEVFHGGVDEFFDGRWHAMNFIDEEDASVAGIGEIGEEVFGCAE